MIVGCCGHRPPRLGGYRIPNAVHSHVMDAIDDHLVRLNPTLGITGMGLGFDQWFAEACINTGLPFVAAIAFNGFPELWPQEARRRYDFLLSRAHQVVYVTPDSNVTYHPSVIARRNHWVAQNAEHMLVAFDGSPGNTSNFMRAVNQVGRPYSNLYDSLSGHIKEEARSVAREHERRKAARSDQPVTSVPTNSSVPVLRRRSSVDDERRAQLIMQARAEARILAEAGRRALAEGTPAPPILRKQRSAPVPPPDSVKANESDDRGLSPDVQFGRIVDI